MIFILEFLELRNCIGQCPVVFFGTLGSEDEGVTITCVTAFIVGGMAVLVRLSIRNESGTLGGIDAGVIGDSLVLLNQLITLLLHLNLLLIHLYHAGSDGGSFGSAFESADHSGGVFLKGILSIGDIVDAYT